MSTPEMGRNPLLKDQEVEEWMKELRELKRMERHFRQSSLISLTLFLRLMAGAILVGVGFASIALSITLFLMLTSKGFP